MDNAELEFLRDVRKFSKDKPHMASHIVQAALSGVIDAMDSTRDQALDMESALACQMTTHSKAKTALPFLLKWKDKTHLNWGWIFKNNGIDY